MNLNKLLLRDFRNYVNLEINFDPGVNLIVGDNAQGKTNLLEAISYAGSGKSFRAMKTEEMVREGLDSPTEFEVVTAVAFLYYAAKQTDFVILEVGLGGKVSALDEIQEKYGFAGKAIVTMDEVVEHLYNRQCQGKVVIDDTIKTAIDEYYKQYGCK